MEIENTGIAGSPGSAGAPVIGGGVDRELVYVGFWPRLAAHLIDIAILIPYAFFQLGSRIDPKRAF